MEYQKKLIQLESDPMNAEYQKEIAEMIKNKNINENMYLMPIIMIFIGILLRSIFQNLLEK